MNTRQQPAAGAECPSALTPADLDLIGRARDLADLNALNEDYADTLGQAQYLLAKLADLAERIGGVQ